MRRITPKRANTARLNLTNNRANAHKKNNMTQNTEWQEIKWPYNSAIKSTCYIKNMKFGRDIILRPKQECINIDANSGYGEWIEKPGFDFTIKNCLTGSCGDIIDLEEAKKYALNYALKF